MLRRSLILALALVVTTWSACAPAPPSEASAPMNVLFITTDDLGLQLSAYGDEVVETPHLDALAASGVLFETAYVAQASCSPSRSAMFTGLYVHANGQYGLTNASDFALHPHLHQATMPNILKRAGYRTGLVGKLHVDPEDQFQWDERGRVNGRAVKEMAAFAEEFITGGGEQPFFLMVNYSDPHAYRERDPVTREVTLDWTFRDQYDGIPETLVEPSEKTVWPFQRVDTPEQRKRIAGYYNEVLRVDVGVGMLLDALERAGRTDDTLVIFIGDHGPPFNRAKTTVYEAGLRVPFLVRWPGVSRPMRSEAMVSTVDILPTILDATGAESDVAMHGKSLSPVLKDADAPWRDYLVGEFHMHGRPWYPRRAIRDGRFKLIHNLLAGEVTPSPNIDGDIAYRISQQAEFADAEVREAFRTFADPPEIEFYDLQSDPWEFKNLADRPEFAEHKARLLAALEQWRRETDDPCLDPEFVEQLRAQVNGD